MADDPRQKTQPARRRRPTAGRCPVCNALARPETRPFCSRRCADVDLGRWLRGAYRIPTDEQPGEANPDEDGEWSGDGGSRSGGHA